MRRRAVRGAVAAAAVLIAVLALGHHAPAGSGKLWISPGPTSIVTPSPQPRPRPPVRPAPKHRAKPKHQRKSRPHKTIRFQNAACISTDCGQYAASLHWQIDWPGNTTTGYYVFVNGTQEDDLPATATNWVIDGGDCGTAITLGVEAHDGSGNHSAMYTSNYTTPACPITAFGDAMAGSSIATGTNQWAVENSVLGNTNGTQCDKAANASETGGFLTETITGGSFTCVGPATGNGTISSGCPSACATVVAGEEIHARDQAFKYGTVKYTAKVAGTGSGGWPAIWLLGNNCEHPDFLSVGFPFTCSWHNTGSEEVDISEWASGTRTSFTSTVYSNDGQHGPCTSSAISDASSNLHNYELDWTPSGISVKVDGVSDGCSFSSTVQGLLFPLISTQMFGTGVPSQPTTFVKNFSITPAGPTITDQTGWPTISGSTVQGGALTALPGTWNGSPTGYTYQWIRCPSGAAASGDTCSFITSGSLCSSTPFTCSSTYATQSADIGDTLKVLVIATNASGSTQYGSDPTATITAPGGPLNTAAPTLAGYATPNSELMANNAGTWSGSPTSYTYQWQDCTAATGGSCSNATNTTGLTGETCSATAFCYVPGSSEVGSFLQAVVTAHSATGTGSATTARTLIATNQSVGAEPGGPGSACGLTMSAALDGITDYTTPAVGDNNLSSCWGQATGITGATGCTEAQLLAGTTDSSITNPCGNHYFAIVTTAQHVSTSKVIANTIIENCVGATTGANNFTLRDDLLYFRTNAGCQGGSSSDSRTAELADGATSSVPTGVVWEDTTVDGRSADLEANAQFFAGTTLHTACVSGQHNTCPQDDSYGVIAGAGTLALRMDIFGWSKNITVDGSSGRVATVQDSFIHDPPLPAAGEINYDCVGAQDWYDPHMDPLWGDGASFITLEHNWIGGMEGGYCDTSPVGFLTESSTPDHNLTVDSNFLWGSGRPDAYFGKNVSGVGPTCATNSTVTNNAFSRENQANNSANTLVFEWSSSGTGDTWSGNTTWSGANDTGSIVALSQPNDCA